MEEFTAGMRIFNLISSMVLLAVLAIAVIWRWKRMDPFERLFSMSLTGYVIYVTAGTIKALEISAPLYWYTPILTVCNIWLITTVIVLSRRELPKAIGGR